MLAGEQIFFGDAARPRLGWIHRPRPETRAVNVGLVIVPPFGYEEICAHRSLRALAIAAADAGALAVRLDLDATGDSAGDELEPDRLAAWLASIADACDLARDAGADRLVLAGVRLGATLAALAAEARSDVVGLVAIAAAPRPKALLRELFLLQKTLGLAPAPASVTTGASATSGASAGRPSYDPADELVGFPMAPATRAELSAIDLTAPGRRPPAPRVLVIDRDDIKSSDAWVAALQAAGADVIPTRLPGYVEMMLDPHQAQIPRAMIDSAVAFTVASPPLADAPEPPHPAHPIARATSYAGGAFQEELVELDECMAGVLTMPASGPPARALLLVNAGSTSRIGPNRVYVRLARRLAARGTAVLRIDLSGLGDSSTRPGQRDNVVYPDCAIGDVEHCARWLRARLPPGREVAISGLCSGAFHALRAALEGDTTELAIPINSLLFHREPGKPIDFDVAKTTAEANRLTRSITSGASWGKLLRGEVDVRAAARVVTKRAKHITGEWAKDALRGLNVELPDDFPSQLQRFARRGGRVRFIFAESDAGRSLLQTQGGRTLPQLAATPALAIATISGADHTFTARWTQAELVDAVERALT